MINPQVNFTTEKMEVVKLFCKMLLGFIFPKGIAIKFLPQTGLGKRLTGPSAQEPLPSWQPSSVSYIDILPSNVRLYDSRISADFLGVVSPIWLKRGCKILESTVDSILAQGNDTLRFEPVVDSQGRRACLVACWMNTPAASKNLYHLDHPSALPKPWCGCASSCLRTAFGSA